MIIGILIGFAIAFVFNWLRKTKALKNIQVKAETKVEPVIAKIEEKIEAKVEPILTKVEDKVEPILKVEPKIKQFHIEPSVSAVEPLKRITV